MILLNNRNSIDVSAGALESLRVVQAQPGQDAPYEVLILWGQVTAGGVFTATIPFVNSMFRCATIRELATMGSAQLALIALWDPALEEPLAAAGSMTGSPNTARLGAAALTNSEPFSGTQDSTCCCAVRIAITSATGNGRFVLKIVFRRG